MKDLQNLIFWIFADGINPKWVLINNRSSIERIVVLFAKNYKVKIDSLVLFQSDTGIFDKLLTTIGPCDRIRGFDPLEDILQSPLSAEKKLELKKQSVCTLETLILTEEELKTHNYPYALEAGEFRAPFQTYKLVDFEETRDFKGDFNVLALDCEMCKCELGDELARISLVDFEGNVVYDTFVKPSSKIIDYVTEFSGLTKEILDPITVTLVDVKNHILKLVSKNTILVGHSLENDLWVLGLIHSRVIDTAVIYSSNRNKPRLSKLAAENLVDNFRSSEGHCSAEDALACMNLVKLKLKKGRWHGQSFSNSKENLVDRISRFNKKAIIIDHHYSNAFQYCNNFHAEEGGQNVVKKIVECQEDLVIANIHEDQNEILDKYFQFLIDNLPKNTLLLVNNCPFPESTGKESARKMAKIPFLKESLVCGTFLKLIK